MKMSGSYMKNNTFAYFVCYNANEPLSEMPRAFRGRYLRCHGFASSWELTTLKHFERFHIAQITMNLSYYFFTQFNQKVCKYEQIGRTP